MKYAVYARYEYPGADKGEIISTHKTITLAEKAAVDQTGHLAIREVPNHARKGENIYRYDNMAAYLDA